MLDAVRTLPQQLLDGRIFAGSAGADFKGVVSRVVICGMGGSAFPGDLLRLLTDALGLELLVSRDYVVHDNRIGPETLVIVSSFSGNTEETLAALDDARQRGAQVVVVSAGGKLAERADALSLPYVRIVKPSPGFQPRAATGFFISAFVTILENAGLIDGQSAALAAVSNGLKTLFSDEPALHARALSIAEVIRGRIPVFYATAPFGDVGKVVKIKLNENSKTPAFFYEIPEFNHNEMVGFTRMPGPFLAVVLEDPTAPERQQHRVATTVATLTDHGMPVERVRLRQTGPNLLRAFEMLVLFDFVSCALAALDGIDPNPVAMVEDFKKRLG